MDMKHKIKTKAIADNQNMRHRTVLAVQPETSSQCFGTQVHNLSFTESLRARQAVLLFQTLSFKVKLSL